MAPNLPGPATGLFLAEPEVIPTSKTEPIKPVASKQQVQYEWHIVWKNVLAFVYLHVGALYGMYLLFTEAKLYTTLFCLVLGYFGGIGVTGGAHRLWAHKSYKAKWPLRLILIFCQSIAMQNHVYEWVRDHRVHHKFTDTDADPHNSKRGFFFSHIGWLMLKKHKDVKLKGVTVDLSDLESDWTVMFQKKYYTLLTMLCCFVIPTWVPVYFWNENFWTAFYVAAITRYVLSLNGTWLVNSAAHLYGMRPYDRTISPRQNKTVSILALGEGWHNYHHAFPWDYRTSEFNAYRTNFTSAFIDFFAKIGWAYDLKTASEDMVLRRANRVGDGTHEKAKGVGSDVDKEHQGDIWGWDDKDMTVEDKKFVEILCRKED